MLLHGSTASLAYFVFLLEGMLLLDLGLPSGKLFDEKQLAFILCGSTLAFGIWRLHALARLRLAATCLKGTMTVRTGVS